MSHEMGGALMSHEMGGVQHPPPLHHPMRWVVQCQAGRHLSSDNFVLTGAGSFPLQLLQYNSLYTDALPEGMALYWVIVRWWNEPYPLNRTWWGNRHQLLQEPLLHRTDCQDLKLWWGSLTKNEKKTQNIVELLFQVSIAGQPHGVEQARLQIRVSAETSGQLSMHVTSCPSLLHCVDALSPVTGPVALGLHVWPAHHWGVATRARLLFPNGAADTEQLWCVHHFQAATQALQDNGHCTRCRGQCQGCERGRRNAAGASGWQLGCKS